VEEHEQTLALIEELKGILASDVKLMAIIRAELLAIREEYGDVRRTEILTGDHRADDRKTSWPTRKWSSPSRGPATSSARTSRRTGASAGR